MATALKQDVSKSQEGPVSGAATPTTAKPSTPTGRRRVILPILGLVALVGGAWAFKQWSYGRTHASTDDAAVDGHLIPVLAKVGGYVERVTVNDNDHVAVDSVLVRVEPAEYTVRLAQAEADLASARASAGSAGV